MSMCMYVSYQISPSVVSDSLWPHESQQARPPCPSPTPGVHSDSRPLSQWCHPAISSSVFPFSSCPQCLPASESFPMSQLFTWGGQSTGVSALASFLPKKSPGLISYIAHVYEKQWGLSLVINLSNPSDCQSGDITWYIKCNFISFLVNYCHMNIIIINDIRKLI